MGHQCNINYKNTEINLTLTVLDTENTCYYRSDIRIEPLHFYLASLEDYKLN